jgi:hypothetical protein
MIRLSLESVALSDCFLLISSTPPLNVCWLSHTPFLFCEYPFYWRDSKSGNSLFALLLHCWQIIQIYPAIIQKDASDTPSVLMRISDLQVQVSYFPCALWIGIHSAD